MLNPKVSIIIPVYNRTALLGETLLSCFRQTYDTIEVVIVDDGSEEDINGCIRIVHGEIRQGHTLKYLRQERANANVARNRGIASSDGDFIQFLDSDDILHPEKIERQVRILQQNPQKDMVYCLGVYFRNTVGDGNILWNVPGHGNDLERFLSDDSVFCTMAPLWKRSFLAKMGPWDERLVCWQDGEYSVRAILSGADYCFINKTLCFIRDHDLARSTTLNNAIERENAKTLVGISVSNLLEKKGMLTGEHAWCMALRHIRTIRDLARQDLHAPRALLQTNREAILRLIHHARPGVGKRIFAQVVAMSATNRILFPLLRYMPIRSPHRTRKTVSVSEEQTL